MASINKRFGVGHVALFLKSSVSNAAVILLSASWCDSLYTSVALLRTISAIFIGNQLDKKVQTRNQRQPNFAMLTISDFDDDFIAP
jgi:hypothetical protein